jgi:hypothetical protein
MGGPVIREKLFFFGAYQHATLGQASTPGNLSFVPTANGVATLNSLATTSGSGVSQVAVNTLTSVLPPAPVADPGQNVTVANNATGALVPIEVGALTPAAPNFFTQHDFQTNGDINLGNHRISLRFAYDRFRAPLVSAFPLPVFTGGQQFDAKSAMVSEVYSISPTIINEFRAGYRRSQLATGVPDIAPPGNLDVYPNLIIEQLGGLELGPDGNSPQSNVLNQYQWVDNLSILRGAHNIKLGADARLWIAPGVFLPRERAEYRYSVLDKFVKDAVPDNLALRGVGDGSFAGNQKAIFWFIQDDWKLHPRLTLNLGLRYEFVTNPRDDGKQAINSVSDPQNPTNRGLSPLLFRVPRQDINNFAPRIGFAWDMFADHKTAMRGGFAVAYDVIFQNLALLQLPPQLQQELGVEQACVALSPQPSWCPAPSAGPYNEEFIVANGTNFLANAGLPGTFIPQTLSPADARAGTQALMVDTVAPKTLTWSLGIQHELGQNNALEVRYVGTRGINLPAQIRRNAALVPDTLFLPTFFSASDVPANVPITAPSVADFQNAAIRPYAADGFLSNITAFDPASSSTYHGGSIEFTRRFKSLGRWGNGVFLRTGYTFSKAIDNATNELFTSQVNPRRPQDFLDLREERGRSTIDHPHKFTIAAIYELPKYDGDSAWLGYVLNQWQVSASYIAESGQPVTALSFVDANGNGDAAGDRAIFNPGFTARNTATGVNAVCRAGGTGATSIVAPDVCGAGDTVGYVAVNPAAQYVQALPGARTNVGRNTLDSPGLNNWNMSFSKKTRMTERVSLEFRADMQNVFNHGQPILGSGNISGFNTNAINGTDLVFVRDNPNFLRPQNVLTNGGSNSPFSGIVTGGNAGFRRFVQFGLKVRF